MEKDEMNFIKFERKNDYYELVFTVKKYNEQTYTLNYVLGEDYSIVNSTISLGYQFLGKVKSPKEVLSAFFKAEKLRMLTYGIPTERILGRQIC